MIDSLALWHARCQDERDAILATLRTYAGGDLSKVEVIAATLDGDDLVVHAIYRFEELQPQQVGADFIAYYTVVLVVIGSSVSTKWSWCDSIDERDTYDWAEAIERMRKRTIDTLFGSALPAEEEAFVAAIDAAPEADGPRLVYADWLQERGDPRGVLIAHARAGKLTHEMVAEYIKPIPWATAEGTAFDRGFVGVLGLSESSNFFEFIEYYARMRPLPTQFVAVGNFKLRACVSRDRRRFAAAKTYVRPSGKQESGVWEIVVGRCADRKELFKTERPWKRVRTKNKPMIERLGFTPEGAVQLEFSTGEPTETIGLGE